VDRAAELLRFGKYNVTEAALEVVYSKLQLLRPRHPPDARLLPGLVSGVEGDSSRRRWQWTKRLCPRQQFMPLYAGGSKPPIS